MRIIGRLPDTRMQITVFENDGRYPVQFEREGLTQIYRFRKGPLLSNFGHLQEYVDEDFRVAVLRTFEGMRATQSRVLERINPPADDTEELPNII